MFYILEGDDFLKNRIRELRKAMGITYCASLPLAHKIAAFFGESIENVFIFEEDK